MESSDLVPHVAHDAAPDARDPEAGHMAGEVRPDPHAQEDAHHLLAGGQAIFTAAGAAPGRGSNRDDQVGRAVVAGVGAGAGLTAVAVAVPVPRPPPSTRFLPVGHHVFQGEEIGEADPGLVGGLLLVVAKLGVAAAGSGGEGG